MGHGSLQQLRRNVPADAATAQAGHHHIAEAACGFQFSPGHPFSSVVGEGRIRLYMGVVATGQK